MSSPQLSRRGLLGVGLRHALDARMGEPERPARDERSAELGDRLAPIAELMVELADVRKTQSVLAAAAGSTCLAGAVASRGAFVSRSASVRFDSGDESFDAVLGFFTITAHRDPRAVADELKRVARPGAPIVLATWSGQPWARYETAYRHFFGFPELDVHDCELAESGMRYSLVFARKPR